MKEKIEKKIARAEVQMNKAHEAGDIKKYELYTLKIMDLEEQLEALFD